MSREVSYEVYVNDRLLGSYAGFAGAGVEARVTALRSPGVLCKVERRSPFEGKLPVLWARYQVVKGNLVFWLR